jgi:hypothetical protein
MCGILAEYIHQKLQRFVLEIRERKESNDTAHISQELPMNKCMIRLMSRRLHRNYVSALTAQMRTPLLRRSIKQCC